MFYLILSEKVSAKSFKSLSSLICTCLYFILGEKASAKSLHDFR